MHHGATEDTVLCPFQNPYLDRETRRQVQSLHMHSQMTLQQVSSLLRESLAYPNGFFKSYSQDDALGHQTASVDSPQLISMPVWPL